MNHLSIAGVLQDHRSPVNRDQVPDGLQAVACPLEEAKKVGQIEVVPELRKYDQVKDAIGHSAGTVACMNSTFAAWPYLRATSSATTDTSLATSRSTRGDKSLERTPIEQPGSKALSCACWEGPPVSWRTCELRRPAPLIPRDPKTSHTGHQSRPEADELWLPTTETSHLLLDDATRLGISDDRAARGPRPTCAQRHSRVEDGNATHSGASRAVGVFRRRAWNPNHAVMARPDAAETRSRTKDQAARLALAPARYGTFSQTVPATSFAYSWTDLVTFSVARWISGR